MKITYSQIVKISTVAAVYAALTIVLAPISYGPIQIRIADSLLLIPYLDFFGLSSAVGLAIGCAIANTFSPYAVYDIVIGSATNFLAGLIAWVVGRMWRKRISSLVAASIMQTFLVTFMIGYLLLHLIFNTELSIALIGVFISGLISISFLGTMLVLFLMKKVS